MNHEHFQLKVTLNFFRKCFLKPKGKVMQGFSYISMESSKKNLMFCKDVMSHYQNYFTHFLPQLLCLYEALAFLARGDVFSSDLTTPLAAPPDETKSSDL